jgi:rhodanese-related sulfurtransferase
MIIGIVGNIGEGKDTVAEYLVSKHDFKRESFANSLKDAVSAVFGWNRILLEGQTSESRAWREQVDPWWAHRLNMPDLTPRLVLQLWGTEVARRSFHDDIWIASLENRLRQSNGNVVISDCRFPNEFSAIRNAGGIIVELALTGDLESIAILKEYKIHESEWAWYGLHVDHVIDNNGTLDELYDKVTAIAKL